MMQTDQAPADIVISYSRTDSDFVDRLEADLKAHDLSTWVDRRQLEGGQVWEADIRSAIDHCRLLLVVISPDALASPWVTKEYRYALKRHKEVIPVRYHPTGELPPALQKLQWVNFLLSMNFEATYPAQLQELLKAIHLRIERYTANEAARLATQQTREQRRGRRRAGTLAFSTLLIVLLAGIILRVFFPTLLHVPSFASAPTATPPPPIVGIIRRIAGIYQGTYTNNQPADFPTPLTLQIQISQTGSQLSGTTTKGGTNTASDSGTIDTNGNFTITGTFADGSTEILYGSKSIVQQGYLYGTWVYSSVGGRGDWDVTGG
jgi:hypothetical protein